MTDNPSTKPDWDIFSGNGNSKQSCETQPTNSSLIMSKYSPSHYQQGKIQVWDFIVDQGLDFLSGNIIKYICRAGKKPNESELDDWLKIRKYVDRKIQAIGDAEPPYASNHVPSGDGATSGHYR